MMPIGPTIYIGEFEQYKIHQTSFASNSENFKLFVLLCLDNYNYLESKSRAEVDDVFEFYLKVLLVPSLKYIYMLSVPT